MKMSRGFEVFILCISNYHTACLSAVHTNTKLAMVSAVNSINIYQQGIALQMTKQSLNIRLGAKVVKLSLRSSAFYTSQRQ